MMGVLLITSCVVLCDGCVCVLMPYPQCTGARDGLHSGDALPLEQRVLVPKEQGSRQRAQRLVARRRTVLLLCVTRCRCAPRRIKHRHHLVWLDFVHELQLSTAHGVQDARLTILQAWRVLLSIDSQMGNRTSSR